MQFIGLSKTQVLGADDGQRFRVGTLGSFEDTLLGTQIFLYIQAAGNVSGRGALVVTLTGESALLLTTALAAVGLGNGHQVGAAQAAMASGQFGWMQVYGRGPVLTLADTNPSTPLNTTATGGAADDDATALAFEIPGIILDGVSGGSPGVNELGHHNWPIVGKILP